jgi:formylmethanofuran dehydrogenase subunit C
MSGGLVLVRGGAGDRVGDRMRRGTIIVEGDIAATPPRA